MKSKLFSLACAGALGLVSLPAVAHEGDPDASHAADHAPIGVMADHRHEKGEWMVSYRYMRMEMAGNRDGTDTLSPDEIVTTVPNRFFGAPMQPPTLRVVPLEMDMQMHMIGGMYGLTDTITLMVMGMYLTSEMDHLTYQGGMGTTVLGGFTTETKGWGDTTVGAIIGLPAFEGEGREVNAYVALSLPTGSIEETDQILTPMGMTPSPRLPYPMQLGSGTYDAKIGLTVRQRFGGGKWVAGGQGMATIRIGENDAGYALGDRFEATAWLAYEPKPWVAFSGRVKAVSQGQIDGIDPAIIAPVQTADPDNSGGEWAEALFGVNFLVENGPLAGNRFAIEYGVPLYRDLNGPQMETDSTLTLGWQKAF